MEDDNAADVDEADEHDGLGTKFEASGVFAEEGELVALAVSASLALGEGCPLALGGGAVDY